MGHNGPGPNNNGYPNLNNGYPPGPSNGYPPFYGPPAQAPVPAPQNPNPPAPSPYSFDAAAYAVNPGPNSTLPKRHRRNQTTPAAPPPAPLKSAMKKTVADAFNSAEQSITRQFTNTFHPQPQQNQNPPGPPLRNRVYSNPTNPNIPKDENEHSGRQFSFEAISPHSLILFYFYANSPYVRFISWLQ